MSNEELVAAIQAGDTSRLGALWDNVCLLIRKMAGRFHRSVGGRGGLEIEDLEQIGFIAMVEAAETYNSQKEAKFATWLCICLRRCFQEASGRLYLDKQGNLRTKDMLDHAVSLNEPLGDDPQGDTLADIVPDPRAEATIGQVEESVWREQLRDAVAGVMWELEPEQAEVLYHRFWKNQTYIDAAEELGITDQNVRTSEARALRNLRRGKYTARLKPFYNFNCYSGTGLGAFKSSGASVQERYMINQEKINENMFYKPQGRRRDDLSAKT